MDNEVKTLRGIISALTTLRQARNKGGGAKKGKT
jgi:hypothetical protein